MLNYDRDYFRMSYRYRKCVGIQLEANIFEANIGCPKAFGNVIISCESQIVQPTFANPNSYDFTTTNADSTGQFNKFPTDLEFTDGY